MKCLNPAVILISGEPLSWRRCPHGYGDGRAHGYDRGHDDGRGCRDHDFVCGHVENRKAFSLWSFYGLNNIYTYLPPVAYLPCS